MTRDELRACMDDQDRLQQLSGDLKQEIAALDRQGNDVKALDAELASKRAAVETANAARAASAATAGTPVAPAPAAPAPAAPASSSDSAAVDRAVEELKAIAARRDDAADAYNVQLKALRERGAAIETQRQGWTERCTTKGYDEMDEAAIRLERKRAGAATK